MVVKWRKVLVMIVWWRRMVIDVSVILHCSVISVIIRSVSHHLIMSVITEPLASLSSSHLIRILTNLNQDGWSSF